MDVSKVAVLGMILLLLDEIGVGGFDCGEKLENRMKPNTKEAKIVNG